MTALNFKIDRTNIDTEPKDILWNGNKIPIKGTMISTGMSYRFMVYFVDRKYCNIPSTYMEYQRLVVKFVPVDEIFNYFSVAECRNKTVYGYFNTECPELNCISINQPVRELCY